MLEGWVSPSTLRPSAMPGRGGELPSTSGTHTPSMGSPEALPLAPMLAARGWLPGAGPQSGVIPGDASSSSPEPRAWARSLEPLHPHPTGTALSLWAEPLLPLLFPAG